MMLGEILAGLQSPETLAALLNGLGGAGWRELIEATAARRGLKLADYAGFAVDNFGSAASDEDWVTLLSALNRDTDPGAACLKRMIDWMAARDGERIGA